MKSWKVEKVTKRARSLEEDSPVAAVGITRGLLGEVWSQCSHYSASSWLIFFLSSGLFCLILGLILCVMCFVCEGTCLLLGKDLVLHFKKRKQLKDEHSERNAELKVPRKHDRSAEHALHPSFSSLKYHGSLKPMGCLSWAKEYTHHVSPVFVF